MPLPASIFADIFSTFLLSLSLFLTLSVYHVLIIDCFINSTYQYTTGQTIMCNAQLVSYKRALFHCIMGCKTTHTRARTLTHTHTHTHTQRMFRSKNAYVVDREKESFLLLFGVTIMIIHSFCFRYKVLCAYSGAADKLVKNGA